MSRQRVQSTGLYIVSAIALLLVGLILWVFVRQVARDVLQLQQVLNRGTLGLLESALIVTVYAGAMLLALPMSRQINGLLRRKTHSMS